MTHLVPRDQCDPDTAWTTIRSRKRSSTSKLQQWVSDAEVAEIPFTRVHRASSQRAVTARLIVRRVRDADPAHQVPHSYGELFSACRHHAVFTDSPLPMLEAKQLIASTRSSNQ